jgi:sugar-specific transcriptional regulator TrmB
MAIASDEDTQILKRLGLTTLQAEVYLTLTRLNKATIKNISSVSKIDRANIYRVLTRLLEINLVEKMLTTPTIFEALPLDEGIQMLLEQKENDNKKTKTQVEEFLKKYKQPNLEAPADKGCEFILIPDGKLTMRKVEEMVSSNQKTHEIIIFWSDFDSQTNEVVDRWTSLLVRGIKLRILVYLHQKKSLPKKIMQLKKFAEFQIRSISGPPKATISIIDGNQAFVSVTPSISEDRGGSGLWVSNPGMVGLIEDYFEMLWRSSKTL